MITTINEFKLYEGLILTHDIYKTISILSNTFNSNDKNIVSTNFDDINKIRVQLYKDKNNNIDINKLVQYLNNLGWYIAYIKEIDINQFTLKPQKYNIDIFNKFLNNMECIGIEFIIEQKYSKINKENIKYLYHLTNSKNVKSILTKGLISKTKNKLTSHPERIYFSTDINKIYLLLNTYKKMYINDTFTILKIVNNDNILYYDHNFITGDAVYTYDNINPKNIEILEDNL